MSRSRALTIAAIMFICILLLTTTIIQAVDAAEKTKDKTNTKTKPEKDGDKNVKDTQEIEKARKAIANADDAISEAENKIRDAENAGLSIPDAKDAISEGKSLLDEAKSILEKDPQRAASLAKRAENMARLAINLVEQASRKIKETREEQIKNYLEIIEEARGIIVRAREAIEEAVRIGGNVSEAIQLLQQAENLLRNAEAELDKDVGEAVRLATQARIIAEKALRISERVREETRTMLQLRVRIREAEELMDQAQIAIMNAESKLQGADLDENTLRTLTEMLGQAREMLEKAREKLSINPEAARTHADIALRIANRVSERIEEQLKSQVELRAGPELNLSVLGNISFHGNMYRVENKLQFTNGIVTMYMEKRVERRLENGTLQIEIIKEKIIVIGNKTLIEQVRILEKNGEVVIEQESSEELNESTTASILEVKKREINITKIDVSVQVDALHRDEDRLRLRVSGPDGLGARIIVIQLSTEALSAVENGDLVVLVNGAEAKLADSVYQLLSDEVDEPAYVLIKTASGYQIMIYFPHFSEYIVEIRAVISRILGALFDSRTALLATTASTIVIAIIMALNTYRKYYSSRGRVLKLW